MENLTLGLDIGGSGIKGAIVDTHKGDFISERIRIPTPKGITVEALLGAIGEIKNELNWNGAIGCGFPGIVKDQVISTAANLGDSTFAGLNLAEEIGRLYNTRASVINDGDAAGIAEVNFGAGKDVQGVVIVLTIGTGIGSSIFFDGHLLPNTELGHLKDLERKKRPKLVSAEKIYGDAARKRQDLNWNQWATQFNDYLAYVDRIFSPNLIILGGGVASKTEKFAKYIRSNCDISIASLKNKAGIIGAAYECARTLR